MRTDLDHLPQAQQDELARVVRILMEEFEAVTSRATQPWKRNGKIYKIILFGSYARDRLGRRAGERLSVRLRPADRRQPRGSDRNRRLLVRRRGPHPSRSGDRAAGQHHRPFDRRGEPGAQARRIFLGRHRPRRDRALRASAPRAWRRRCRVASRCLRDGGGLFRAIGWQSVDAVSKSAQLCTATRRELKDSSILLHQATERAYICFLLVRTLYFPRSHNIKFLRSLAEDKEPRLIEAWPRATKLDRRRFELLKRAYVEARYSANYEISEDDLEALTTYVRGLRDLVEHISLEWLANLRKTSGR